MQRSTLANRAWILLFAVICITYFYGLGRAPLLGPDEPRYAQVAREMFERGDWVTPTLAGHTWFEKPALLYWLMMASFGIFGVTEAAARLGPACAALLTVLTMAWLARRVERIGAMGNGGSRGDVRGFSLITAAVTASTAGLFVFARAASFDILVTAAISIALSCFFVSELEEDETKRRWPLAGFYGAVGAALLAKGLVGVVIPCGIITLYFLLRRRWPHVSKLGWWWGPLLTIGVAATWYAPMIARHGWIFIDNFFVQHHFARYVSNKYRHPQPPYFYLPIILLLALPWTAFLVTGVVAARRWHWRGEDAASKFRVISFAWLVFPIAFFSLSGSKLPGYVLPALPGAILLASEQLARYLKGEGGGRAMRATGALILLLSIAGMIFALYTRHVSIECALATCTSGIVAGTLALGWAHRRLLCAATIVGATLLTVILIVNCALEPIARRESMRDLLRVADARGYASAPIFQLYTVERSAEFYASKRLAYDARGEPISFEGVFQVANAARAEGGPVLVIVSLEYVSQLIDDVTMAAEVVGDNGEYALVTVKAK